MGSAERRYRQYIMTTWSSVPRRKNTMTMSWERKSSDVYAVIGHSVCLFLPRHVKYSDTGCFRPCPTSKPLF